MEKSKIITNQLLSIINAFKIAWHLELNDQVHRFAVMLTENIKDSSLSEIYDPELLYQLTRVYHKIDHPLHKQLRRRAVNYIKRQAEKEQESTLKSRLLCQMATLELENVKL